MRLEFVEHGLYLPALVAELGQLHRRRKLRIQQRSQQPVARLRIVNARQCVLDNPHADGLLGSLGAADAGRTDDLEEGAIVEHAFDRQLPGWAACLVRCCQWLRPARRHLISKQVQPA